MSGNSFGKNFRITTFGESHGPGIGVVLDGVPAGLEMDEGTDVYKPCVCVLFDGCICFFGLSGRSVSDDLDP